MKIAGVIAEYNPFHNGHAYQIRELKKRTGADYVIAAMSGDFVQRGAPAIIDKYARTKMALSCGIDLVIELPALWALSSAEYFASAGTHLFAKMGCVDYLCFGAETDDLSFFSAAAKLLADEPDSFRSSVSAYLKRGFSYPLAREHALKDAGIKNADILSTPNNILALEYIKSLLRQNSSITPVILKRKGAGYHEKTILCENPSASAIRNILLAEEKFDMRHILPKSSAKIIKKYQADSVFLSSDDFSSLLGYELLCRSKDELGKTADLTVSIANRLKRNICSFQSFTQFCSLNKSRNLTGTRMSRIFFHILLYHTADDYIRYAKNGYVPYLRMLGFKKTAEPLLSVIKKSTEIPLISKAADAKTILPADSYSLFLKDIFAANLYEQVKYMKNSSTCMTDDFTKKIVIVP